MTIATTAIEMIDMVTLTWLHIGTFMHDLIISYMDVMRLGMMQLYIHGDAAYWHNIYEIDLHDMLNIYEIDLHDTLSIYDNDLHD